MLRNLIPLLLLFCFASPAFCATEPMIYIHNGPESPLDKRYEFHWEILQTALERTRAQFGSYELKNAVYMSESRQTMELQRASGRISVMFLGTKDDLEKNLIPIRIPVDKDLSGYFVLLIRPENREAIAKAKTLDDIRSFTIGLGSDWLDNAVYRANGFRTMGGSNYDGLFTMLNQKHFDAFPRSVVEILKEYDARKNILPEIVIEESLLIHYYWPMYFWFSNNNEGRRLAERAELGMRSMIKDGSYDAIFSKYFRAGIERLHLKNRRLLELRNPFLPGQTPVLESDLWYRP